MTQPTTVSRSRPLAAAIVGVLIGVLTILEGFFHSGHLPASADVASVLGGSGVSLGSLAAFVMHEFGISKTVLTYGNNLITSIEPVTATLAQTDPGLEQRILAAVDTKLSHLPYGQDLETEVLAVLTKLGLEKAAPSTAAPGAPPAGQAPPAPGPTAGSAPTPPI